MSMENRIPVIYLEEKFDWTNTLITINSYRDSLAAGIVAVDKSVTDDGREHCLHFLKLVHEKNDINVYACGNVKRFEDVKKFLYAGAVCVYCNESETEGYADGLKRFGEAKVKQINILDQTEEVEGVTVLKDGVIVAEVIKPAFVWSDIKLNSDGMVPVIVQDYRTNEVLMLAYMNEDAYNETIRQKRMVYYSRSRNEQWVKGLTSGHFQYVKSMYLDCDKDTILAKVYQVGAACHTGKYSCFFNEIMNRTEETVNPHEVLENVMKIILDRKVNPKEGSYTNYLFDKGIDKILKKCGEEATEIVIAAKNPDKEEIKYEIADFLYHVCVLMALKDVTWDEVMTELATR